MQTATTAKIGFIGKESVYSRDLARRLKLLEHHGATQLIYLNAQELDLQTIVNLDLKALVVDMNYDCPNFDKLFSEVKSCFYPQNLFIFAFSSVLDEKEISRIQKLGHHFVYHRTGQGSDEARFLAQSIVKSLYPESGISNEFAIAKINQDSIIEVPINFRKISSSEIVFQGNFRPLTKDILSVKHDFIRKLTWRNTNLGILKIEECADNLHDWQTTLKTDPLRLEDVDRFETDFVENFGATASEETKKNQYRLFLKTLFQEKKSNLLNFYRKFRFDCDPFVRAPIMLISQKNLNFKLKGEEVNEAYSLYKRNLISPSMALLKKVKPALIFFESDVVPEDFKENPKFRFNEIETLRYLVDKLVQESISTQILVFSEETMDLTGMPSFVKQVPFAFEEKLALALLKEKIPKDESKSQLQFKNDQAPDPTLWLSERNSFGRLEVAAKIEAISELEIAFTCAAELPEYTLLKASYPFPFYLTIIPGKNRTETGETRRYRAIINGLTTDQRDALRGFVITFNSSAA